MGGGIETSGLPHRRRRLLSVATLYPRPSAPGFGSFVQSSREALVRFAGWDVTVLNPVPVPPLAFGRYARAARDAGDADEVGVEILRRTFLYLPRLGARWTARLAVRALLPEIRRRHAERPFDMVDAQYFFPDGPIAAGIARALDRPLAITARGSDILHWGGIAHAREQMVEAAHAASRLYAVSDQIAAKMEALGMPGDRIVRLRPGIDQRIFRLRDRRAMRAELAARRGIDLPDGAPLLVGLGSLIPLKRHDLTVRAMALLPEARLVLCGEGPERKRLERLVREQSLGDRVTLLGQIEREDIARILAAADMMVLPSQREGFAYSWVEALACGARLVATDVGAAGELVASPVAGAVSEPSPHALAASIGSLLDNPCPRQATADIVRDFDWRAKAEKVGADYRAILGG